MSAAVVTVRRRRSSWTIWNRRSARRIRLLCDSLFGLDQPEYVPLWIFEDAEGDIRHHRARGDHLPAKRDGLFERRGHVGRLGVERHPRPCAGEGLSDPSRNAARIAGFRHPVVDRLDHVERPPEQIAVESLELSAVVAEHFEPHHRVHHLPSPFAECEQDDGSNRLLTASCQESAIIRPPRKHYSMSNSLRGMRAKEKDEATAARKQ